MGFTNPNLQSPIAFSFIIFYIQYICLTNIKTYPMSKLFQNIDNSSAVQGLSNPSSEPQTMEDEEEQTMTHQSATSKRDDVFIKRQSSVSN